MSSQLDVAVPMTSRVPASVSVHSLTAPILPLTFQYVMHSTRSPHLGYRFILRAVRMMCFESSPSQSVSEGESARQRAQSDEAQDKRDDRPERDGAKDKRGQT